jgi:hypothetical protein
VVMAPYIAANMGMAIVRDLTGSRPTSREL